MIAPPQYHHHNPNNQISAEVVVTQPTPQFLVAQPQPQFTQQPQPPTNGN